MIDGRHVAPRAQALQESDPAPVGQHQVEQDQVIGRTAHRVARRVEPRDPVDRMPVGRDLVAHRGAQNRVVLDQQDAHGRPVPSPGGSP